MLLEQALRLRQDWAMKGNPPCSHNVLDHEYYWGKNTGSYICTTCGRSFTREEWEQEIEGIDHQPEFVADSRVTRQTGRRGNGLNGFLNRCGKLYTSLSRKVINKS
jgi:hypothetical protein